MQVNLYSGYVPYLGFWVNSVQTFVPFRHTLELFTKSPDYDMWYFDGMDEEEFTEEMRKIRDCDFIIALDRNYKHGTMITCMSETIHGNRFSIHSKKNYRIENNIRLDVSFDISDKGPDIYDSVMTELNAIQLDFPQRFSTQTNVPIRPEGRVCIYTMNCLTYKHVH